MITAANRQALLDVARTAILATVRGTPHPPPKAAGELARRAAAFVSLHVSGALRGCVGHLEEDYSLVETVARCARLACTEDPRFPAVTPVEVDLLEVEISVLGPLERVGAIGEIVVGRHGLLVEHNRRRGLLLPQVATDYRWTPEVFVEQTCMKAGLLRDGWQRGATLWRFEAEVFGAPYCAPSRS
jgi:AmmeMemoRadiSam system protein A